MPIAAAAGVRGVHSLDDLRAVPTVPVPQWRKLFVREAASYVYWEPESSEADDGDAAIQPTDRSSLGGRWVRPTAAIGLALPFAFDQWNRSEDIVNNAGQVGSWPAHQGIDGVTVGGFGTPDYSAARIAGRPAAVFNPTTFDLLEYDGDIETDPCDQLHVFVLDPDNHCSVTLNERYYIVSSANNLHAEAMFCAHTVNTGSALTLKWAGFSNSAADADPDVVNVLWHPFRRPSAGAITHAVRGPQIVVMLLRGGGTSKMWRASMWGEIGELVGESAGYVTKRPYYAGSLMHAIGAGDNADGISTSTHFRGAMSELLFKNVEGVTVSDEQIAQVFEFFLNKFPITNLGYKAPSAYFASTAPGTFGGGAWFEWNHRVTAAEWVDANGTTLSQGTGANQPAVSNGVTVWSPGGGTKGFGGSDIAYCVTNAAYEYFVLIKLVSATLTNANRWTNHNIIGDNAGNWWLTADAVGGGATRNVRAGHFGAAQHNATGVVTPGTWHIVHAVFNGAADTLTIDIDGAGGETVGSVTDINGVLTGRPLRMSDNAVGQSVDAKIAEFICFPYVLSAGARTDMFARLNDVRTQVMALGE